MIASRSGLSPPLRSSLVQLHRAGCTIGLWLSASLCRLVKPVLRIDVRLLACSFKGCLLLLRGPLTLRPSRMVIAEPHEVTMALGLHVVGRQAREDGTWRWYICNRDVEVRGGGRQVNEQKRPRAYPNPNPNTFSMISTIALLSAFLATERSLELI